MEKGKVSYTKEYRTLLEKLLESHVRLTEVKGDKKLQAKIETLIDKLIYYFITNVDRSLTIQREIHEREQAEREAYQRTRKEEEERDGFIRQGQ